MRNKLMGAALAAAGLVVGAGGSMILDPRPDNAGSTPISVSQARLFDVNAITGERIGDILGLKEIEIARIDKFKKEHKFRTATDVAFLADDEEAIARKVAALCAAVGCATNERGSAIAKGRCGPNAICARPSGVNSKDTGIGGGGRLPGKIDGTRAASDGLNDAKATKEAMEKEELRKRCGHTGSKPDGCP